LIRVRLTLDGKGRLSSLSAQGHSFRQGLDFSPACAAVTALLRTAAGLFEAQGEVEAHISLPEEGNMEIHIGEIPDSLSGRYQGITDFLVCGLVRISTEAPKDLDVQVVQNGI
jgi:uncharacterized protein YsxB (DUF464 family)